MLFMHVHYVEAIACFEISEKFQIILNAAVTIATTFFTHALIFNQFFNYVFTFTLALGPLDSRGKASC